MTSEVIESESMMSVLHLDVTLRIYSATKQSVQHAALFWHEA